MDRHSANAHKNVALKRTFIFERKNKIFFVIQFKIFSKITLTIFKSLAEPGPIMAEF